MRSSRQHPEAVHSSDHLPSARPQHAAIDVADPQCAAEDLVAAAETVPWPEQNGDFFQDAHSALIAVASHPNTPPELLSRFSRATSLDLRVAVAAHPKVPSKDLTRLSRSDSYDLRSVVASNPECPPRVLARLAKEPDHRVVAGVAYNPACASRLLSKIGARPPMWGWSCVRAAVAEHPNTPLETLQHLHDFTVSELRRLAGTDLHGDDAYNPDSEFYDPDGDDRMHLGDELVWAAEVIQQAVIANPRWAQTQPT